MKVGVCIVGFRSPDDIAACLDGLDKQSHRSFAVTLCENGGVEAHAELERRFGGRQLGSGPLTIIAASDNPGYAGGVNRAIAATPGVDAWWVLNPDTVPASDCLAALVARLEKGDVAIVGGRIVSPQGALQSCGGRWRSRLARVESIGHGWPTAAPTDASIVEPQLDYQSGASMLVDRAVVDRIGPMREDYFLYCEEVEWCVRAKDAGFRIGFAPNADVVHHQGATTGSGGSVRSRRRPPIFLDERNKINMVRDLRPAHLATAIPAALALALLRYGKAFAFRQLGYALAGWWAGVRNERGKPRWF